MRVSGKQSIVCRIACAKKSNIKLTIGLRLVTTRLKKWPTQAYIKLVNAFNT